MSNLRLSYLKSANYLLESFPCVVVLGARQVGKTTFIRSLRPDAPFFDLERQSDFQQIFGDPDFFLKSQQLLNPGKSIVFDEAQLLPSLFPALRVAIDQNRSKMGQFLVSGSSSPDLARNIHETLAGRVAILQMSGFNLEEVFQKEPSPLFHMIQKGNPNDFLTLEKRYQQEELLEACLIGGYPEPVTKKDDPHFVSLWMENYMETYVKRDVRDLFPGIQSRSYQQLLHMLAHSSGQILNASNFARSLDISQPTVKSYLRIAEGTYIWRNLESFDRNVVKRVSKMPKGYFRDSGLLNSSLRIRSVADFLNHPQCGAIWESFVIEQLLTGFSQRLIPVRGFYYRTHNQTEIDLILEGDFGILPVEIKLGGVADVKKLHALEKFVEEHKLPYGLVVNHGDRVNWLKPRILQIPASYL